MTEKRRLVGDGVLQTYETVSEEEHQQAEQTIITTQTLQIKEEYGKQLETVNNSLPSPAEQFTWAMQLTEALAWQNAVLENKESMQLPLIDALCQSRQLNETREALIAKILANYQSYVDQIAPILGQQKQELSQLINQEPVNG